MKWSSYFILQSTAFVKTDIHENLLLTMAPLLETTQPTDEIYDFFSKVGTDIYLFISHLPEIVLRKDGTDFILFIYLFFYFLFFIFFCLIL